MNQLFFLNLNLFLFWIMERKNEYLFMIYVKKNKIKGGKKGGRSLEAIKKLNTVEKNKNKTLSY